MASKSLAAILVRPRSALWVGATLLSAARARRLRAQPHVLSAGLHLAGNDRRPLQELRRVSRNRHHRGFGSAPGQLSSLAVRAVDLGSSARSKRAGAPGSGSVRSTPVDPKAKSRLGEPPFDETSSSRDSQSTPPPAPKASGSAPAIQGPTTSLSPSSNWGLDSATQERTARTGTKRVRQASLSDRLKPYLDESSANELIYPNKADRPWRYIVLHHSAAASGNYDQIDAEHRKVLGLEGCGYHFVIGNGNGSGDGQIEVAQRWTTQKQGVHCRNARTHDVDEYGIGICLVGDLDKEPPTPRQIGAAKALIAHLSTRYDIAQARVETHSHLAATKTVCPGQYFPNEEILARTNDLPYRRPVRAAWKVVHDGKPE